MAHNGFLTHVRNGLQSIVSGLTLFEIILIVLCVVLVFLAVSILRMRARYDPAIRWKERNERRRREIEEAHRKYRNESKRKRK